MVHYHRELSLRGPEYIITGRREAPQESKLELRVHPMELTSDDKHDMQLDSNYVPKPVVNDRLSSAFSFTIHRDIAYVSDLAMPLAVYLTTLSQLLSNPRKRKTPLHSA